MPFQLVRHKVRDYEKWRATFHAHMGKRKELGSKGARVFRNSEKPDEVLVLVEWGSLSKAREFMNWGDPSEIRKESGVVDQPDCYLLEQVDRTAA